MPRLGGVQGISAGGLGESRRDTGPDGQLHDTEGVTSIVKQTAVLPPRRRNPVSVAVTDPSASITPICSPRPRQIPVGPAA